MATDRTSKSLQSSTAFQSHIWAEMQNLKADKRVAIQPLLGQDQARTSTSLPGLLSLTATFIDEEKLFTLLYRSNSQKCN
jgi:hypothetical protein